MIVRESKAACTEKGHGKLFGELIGSDKMLRVDDDE